MKIAKCIIVASCFTLEFFVLLFIVVEFCFSLRLTAMTDCLYCDSSKIRKNGKLSSGGQRWKCVECHKQFSRGGARDTYSPDFKKKVIDMYCHSPAKAREVLEEYGISSRTLIEWKKGHVSSCDVCEGG